jgi:hypothetical protein
MRPRTQPCKRGAANTSCSRGDQSASRCCSRRCSPTPSPSNSAPRVTTCTQSRQTPHWFLCRRSDPLPFGGYRASAGHCQHQGLHAARRDVPGRREGTRGADSRLRQDLPPEQELHSAVTNALAPLLDQPAQIQAGQVTFLPRTDPGSQARASGPAERAENPTRSEAFHQQQAVLLGPTC